MNDSFDELNKFLFDLPYDYSNKNWIIKVYFDRMYNDRCFLEVIDSLIKNIGFSTDGAYCHFASEYDGFLDDMTFEEGVFLRSVILQKKMMK